MPTKTSKRRAKDISKRRPTPPNRADKNCVYIGLTPAQVRALLQEIRYADVDPAIIAQLAFSLVEE